MKSMSNKEKLEKDYEKFNQNIERIAKEEVNTIREKISAVKDEAGKVGEAVELSLNKASEGNKKG